MINPQTGLGLQRVGRSTALWLALAAIALLVALLPPLWSGVLLAVLMVLTVVVVRPRWALYLLPFAVPFGSIREVALGPATVGGTEALLGLFLLVWVARGLAFRSLQLRRPPLWGAMLVWLGTMLLSLLAADSLAASLKELIKWIETFLLMAIVAQELDRKGVAILMGSTLLAASVAALEGIYQAIFQVGPAGFSFPLGGRMWLRAYGKFIQPNPFGGYMGVVLPLAYSLVAAGAVQWWRHRSRPWQTPSMPRWVVLVGAALSVVAAAIFLTLSRGAWLGAAAAVVVTAMLFSRRAAIATTVGGTLLLLFLTMGGIAFLPPALAQRLTDFIPYINIFDMNVRGVVVNPTNFAVIERIAHWQAGYAMWADSPWIGQGIGNYGTVYHRFYVRPWTEALGHAHNLILNTLAETGVVGLIGYLLFWGSAFALAARAVRATRGYWRALSIGIVAALVHLHVHNFFDNLYVHGIYLHIALLLGSAAVLSRPAEPFESHPIHES